MNFTTKIYILCAFIVALGFARAAKSDTVVLAAGSAEQHIFANGVNEMEKFMKSRGVITKMSVDGPNKTSLAALSNVKYSGNCFVFITSHGSKSGTTEFGNDRLTPSILNFILEDCKQSVVLISSCYSGVYTGDVMKKDSRIILTASAPNRPSFGCSNDLEFTFWDGCLLNAFKTEKNWVSVYSKTSYCVSRKEEALGYRPSMPMIYVGKDANQSLFLD